jgi:hypothetical protein
MYYSRRALSSEGPFGDLYPESATEVARINLAWECLARTALPVEASAEVIADLADKG